ASGGFDVQLSYTYAEEELSGKTFGVSVADVGGASTSQSTNTFSVADAALSSTTAVLTAPVATEGAAFTNVTVLHFTDADPNAAAGDYTATVTLGDGNTLTLTSAASGNGQIVPHAGGGFDVQLSYTYAEELSGKTFGASVLDTGGASTSQSINTFSVADAVLSSTAADLTPPVATEGAAFTNVTVLHFTDTDPNAAAGDYTATVALGDGNTLTLTSAASGNGQIVAHAGGGFDVQLSYTYAEELSGKTFGVSVSDAGGAATSQSINNFSVADATLSSTAADLTPPVATAGVLFSNVTVFHFTDADPNAAASDYTATVTLGDGQYDTLTSTPSGTGQIVVNANGGFDVQLSYTYATALSGATFGVSVADAGGATTSQSISNFSVAPASGGLSVTQVQATDTGFTVTFNQAIDPAVLHLYDTAANGNRAADVTLVGATVGAIGGSLVVGPNSESATFIATAGVLPPDTYTLTLRGAADAFETPSGTLLTGSDGTPGDNYTTTLTVANPPSGAVTVSLPSFARGPGQDVNLPANVTSGIPLTASNASGITSLTLDLDYNPALLDITGATTSVATATVTIDTSTSGVAHITFSSTVALAAATNEDLVDLTADVPTSAANQYRATQILAVRNVSINSNAIAALDGDALQVVAYLGDARGQLGNTDLFYKGGDALLVARAAVHLDSGFAAYPLIDPLIVGHTRTGAESFLGGGDSLQIARAAVGLSSSLPPLPNPLPTTMIATAAAIPTSGSSSTRPEATTIPARIWRRSSARCAATSNTARP
ncbi:MAG TPA: hypothetical protein PK867_03355, partial [Pirellulales bacterium]|nr:hypothetical protein [Pirellulales bacterium]